MLNFFIEGNPFFMGILTILLIGIFVAAWKAPAWVKELGLIAFAFGLLTMVFGLRQIFDVIQTQSETIPLPVISGGIKVVLIPIIYGSIIYIVSLIIRLIQKPRI